jgi:SAM-dependent methyltransferase
LFGIDVSPVAISRCEAELGTIASFAVGGIESVQEFYDVIYTSNLLEHFADYEERARLLVRHCGRLCILVPYNEREGEAMLSPREDRHHQHTFLGTAFDFLVRERLAARLHTHIISVPGAWGWTGHRRVLENLKNIVRPLCGKKRINEPLQIIYDVVALT